VPLAELQSYFDLSYIAAFIEWTVSIELAVGPLECVVEPRRRAGWLVLRAEDGAAGKERPPGQYEGHTLSGPKRVGHARMGRGVMVI